jgi:hypothetical protein
MSSFEIFIIELSKIFMSLDLCLDDTKIDIDYNCTKTGNKIHLTKMEQQNTLYEDGKSKQTDMWKSHLFIIKRKKKKIAEVILGQNSP